MDLEELNRLRESAGIKFKKSFRCQDAEKNIHLFDEKKFFKKFLEKLNEKGFNPDSDLTFNVIRYKYQYAERHHVGQTYEWKYFYSTTFDISDDLLNYLSKHNFIYKRCQEKIKQTYEEQIEFYKSVIEKNKLKIETFSEFIYKNMDSVNQNIIENYQKAIENCNKKNINCEKKIVELKILKISKGES